MLPDGTHLRYSCLRNGLSPGMEQSRAKEREADEPRLMNFGSCCTSSFGAQRLGRRILKTLRAARTRLRASRTRSSLLPGRPLRLSASPIGLTGPSRWKRFIACVLAGQRQGGDPYANHYRVQNVTISRRSEFHFERRTFDTSSPFSSPLDIPSFAGLTRESGFGEFMGAGSPPASSSS